jgi:copper resistance protein B
MRPSWWLCLFVTAATVLLPAVVAAQDPHAGHAPAPKPAAKEEAAPKQPPVEGTPREPIPPVTDADRAAAFPADLHGHATHEGRVNSFVLFDQFEWQGGAEGGLAIENKSWIGGDINRVWLRAEGESDDGDVEAAHVHVLYGRSVSRWWDMVAGLRQDFEPGPAQSWLAVGVQGLAPYWFEIEATGYIGPDARTQARFEVEYELLFTNRVILQPLIELEISGKNDPDRRIGAGLSSIETGLRLRYEFRRELAPYIGVTWHRKLFGTADFARAAGEDAGAGRLAIGLRTWF